jgi:dihydroorotate dehydrogenase electron transfer subunit
MYVRNVELTDIVLECSGIKTFFFDHRFDFIPGQYVMIWIRGVDEIPMSLSYADAITVRSVGEATSELFKLSIGDEIGIRGPYGNGFKDPDNSVLLIAGGLGAAPLAPLAETLKGEVITILGAKTKGELLFVDRFTNIGDVLITTDDGSCGHAGFPVDLLGQVKGYNEIISCGPEKMMKAVLDFATTVNLPAQFSLQRYIKCGIGLCGSCCIDPDGLRVCTDGPVFTSEQLLQSEFGYYARDASGRKVDL